MTDGENPTVLVVEDQEGLAEAYTAVLASKYEVLTATSGREALDLVSDTVDVILLDRRMPGMSGDEVLVELAERGIEAKIAMLTAVEPDVDIIEMQFDTYVTKPIDNDQLVELVDSLLCWAEYDEISQQYLRLSSKKDALEAADRQTTEAYGELKRTLVDIRDDVNPEIEDLDDTHSVTDLGI